MEKRQPTSARKQQIVQAALAIINEQGVHRLTAAEIAARVGISDGTIFRHFANKQEIVHAAIDHFEALLFQDFPPEHPEPLERLRTFFAERLALLQDHPAILQLTYTDRLAEAAGQEGHDRMQNIMLRNFAFVRFCLTEAQERGEIAGDIPPEIFIWMVTGVMRGLSMALQKGLFSVDDLSVDDVWLHLETVLRRSSGKA